MRPTDAAPRAAVDDYLKAIYQHTEWQHEPITVSVLAAELSVAAPSVTGMIKKLAAICLVEHEPYGPIRLTPDGVDRALRVLRRHRLIETWLAREMHFGWHEVHDEAEVLEHAISDRLLDAIDERLGRPERDPHGDAIPDAAGRVPTSTGVVLANLSAGDTGTVARVSDRHPDLLARLEASGITPTTQIRVLAAPSGGATIDLPDRRGESVRLSAAEAHALWITPVPGAV